MSLLNCSRMEMKKKIPFRVTDLDNLQFMHYRTYYDVIISD